MEEWYDEVSTLGGNDNKFVLDNRALLYLTFPQPLIKTRLEYEISNHLAQEESEEYKATI
jgi:hypothetical protein